METAAAGRSASSAYGGENSIQFGGKNNNDAEIIASFIRGKIDDIKNSPNGNAVQQLSPVEELKKYKELLDLGAISQEEFDLKKKELLGL